jgi:hypothetical protein
LAIRSEGRSGSTPTSADSINSTGWRDPRQSQGCNPFANTYDSRAEPTFPGYRSCWSRSSVPGGSAATNSIAADSLKAKTGKMPAPLGRNSLLCVHQGVPLPSSAVASDLISRSRWCRRRPKLGDQHQDFLEHLSRHRDLGHLKGCVAAVAHDLGAVLPLPWRHFPTRVSRGVTAPLFFA